MSPAGITCFANSSHRASCVLRGNLFLILFFAAVFLIAGCASAQPSFQYGRDAKAYSSLGWIKVMAGDTAREYSGYKRLTNAMDVDRGIKAFVDVNGLPNYIRVIDRKEFHIAYIEKGKIYRLITFSGNPPSVIDYANYPGLPADIFAEFISHDRGTNVAVGAHKEGVASPTAPPVDHLIVPGQRIGPLMLNGTIEDIAKLFGPGIEKGPSAWPGQGAMLHAWDSAGVWVISDKTSGNLLWISIEPNEFAHWNTYTTMDGLRIGVSESEIAAAMGKPERIVDENGMRSLYYDSRGIRFILGEKGAYAGKVAGIRIVWPSIAHGDVLIVPGKRISMISIGEELNKLLSVLGGGYLRTDNLRGEGVYYWPHLGLSLVEQAGRVASVRSGTNFLTDAANLHYRTSNGIGRDSSAAEITSMFGGPDQIKPAEKRFIKAKQWWIYQVRGIAFALDDEQHIRVIDVFRPTGEPQRESSAPKPTPLSDENEYVNPVCKWSIRYPNDWTMDSSDLSYVKIKPPVDSALVGIHCITVDYTSLDDFVNSVLTQNEAYFRQKGETMVVMSRRPAYLSNGVTAVEVNVEIRPGGKSRRIYVLVDKQAFLVDAETYIEKWDMFHPYFDRIISSFTVLK